MGRKSLKDIERSIIKKYRKTIWSKFIKAINEYDLIQENNKIAICISGGKDSLLLAKLMQELQRHGKIKFELKFIGMDPGFHEINRQAMVENCEYLNIPLELFNADIFKIVGKMEAKTPCYLCARMRRGSLYNYAKSIGCNKIALGHHFDDVIETTLMNVLYAGEFKTMMPKLKSSNYENMELIRPMVYVREEDIIAYGKYNGILAMNCGCEVVAGKYSSTRAEIKQLIASYKKTFFDVDKSIFSAGANVNLDAIISYSKDGVKHSFLESYDEE